MTVRGSLFHGGVFSIWLKLKISGFYGSFAFRTARVHVKKGDKKNDFTSKSLFCRDIVFHYFSFAVNVSVALIYSDVAMQIQIGGQLYRMGTRE